MKKKDIQTEIRKLHYPTRDRIISFTALTLITSVISSLIITADTRAVTLLVEQILKWI